VSNIDTIITLTRPITHVLFKTVWEGTQTTLHTALSHDVPQHNGAYYADCVPTSVMNDAATNDTLADQLWDVSVKLLRDVGFPVPV